MKVKVKIDNTICSGTLNKKDLFVSLASMFFHFNEPDEWIFFKIKNIKGNPKYETWNFIYVTFNDIIFEKRWVK